MSECSLFVGVREGTYYFYFYGDFTEGYPGDEDTAVYEYGGEKKRGRRRRTRRS
jgi:hypothetical protein